MKKYYQVMVRHTFLCQDGYDYLDGEYSGVIHSKKADANRELREAKKIIAAVNDHTYHAFIQEMEN